MEGLAASEHIMRVVPDTGKIPPGYLFAYLSSPLGQGIIKSGIFGSVVDTISPEFIGTIPVPRLDSVEDQIHELVTEAASLRVAANKEIRHLCNIFNQRVLQLPQDFQPQYLSESSHAIGSVILKDNYRLDAFHYVGYATEYLPYIKDSIKLKHLASVTLPGPFKRMYTGPTGVPFLSGIDVFQIKVNPRAWLSKYQPELSSLMVTEVGTILIQADGSRYGLIGRPAYVDELIVDSAFSNHLVRIQPKDKIWGGYLFIFFSTQAGRRQILRQSYGAAIPTIPVDSFKNLIIPQTKSSILEHIGSQAHEALLKRTLASRLENKANSLLLEALGWPR